MPGSFCTVCRTRIASGSRCGRHRTASPSSRAWAKPGAGKLRQQVLSRDRYRCLVCGSSEHLEVHHVIPVAIGGTNRPENLVTLCRDCHREADRDPPPLPA